ncbi:MAG: MgtC/SapB family protein [Deltaproteobacteria bacterium]|nr:MgtC/SapB family protein [Deltaproteobacteria bacterium]
MLMQLDYSLFMQLAYALGIGLLIGLERSLTQSEYSTEDDASAEEKAKAAMGEFMGLRTFAALSLVGFGAAIASEKFALIAPVALAGIALLVIAMYRRATDFGTGITTEVAAIGAAALGMLCRYHPHAAGVIALVLTVILASKRFTYSTVNKMRRVELTDTLKFLVVILIVLPLLPNRALDPYEAFNPYKVGLLVVLISGISFVGYFLTRILGAQKGLGLTGILGGLTSSTAVTAAMAAEAKQHPELNSICAFSTLAANATMFVRVLVVVALLDRELVMRLVWSVGGMAVTAAIVSGVLWLIASRSKVQGDGSGVKLKNPFSVGPAIKFAIFFVVILFVVKLAKTYFGDQGLYAAAALSGLADVDAITLSISEQANAGQLLREVGSVAITIAVVSNSVVKTGISFYSGGLRFGRTVGIGLGLATVVGMTAAFII